MRALLRLMQPDNFEDISAALALYRPGPMGADSHTNYALRKNGRQPIEPIHPELAEPLADILDTTYGLIVYQEQVQQIAQRVAGYSLGKADLLRRAMGKKKKEVLDAEYVPFSEGMKANGFTEASIAALWGATYPLIRYLSAYLSPFAMAGLRGVLAAIVVLIFLWMRGALGSVTRQVAAASLMPVNALPEPSWQSTLGLGFLSSVFDNIPLTALALEQGGYADVVARESAGA